MAPLSEERHRSRPSRAWMGISTFFILLLIVSIPTMYPLVAGGSTIQGFKNLLWASVVCSWIAVGVVLSPTWGRALIRDLAVLIAVILASADMIHVLLYGIRPNMNVYLSIFNTHFAEASEFIIENLNYSAVGTGLFVIGVVVGILTISRRLSRVAVVVPRWCIGICLAFPIASLGYVSQIHKGRERAFMPTPFAPLMLGADYVATLNLYQNMSELRGKIHFATITRRPTSERETYVLVLGESTNRGHMGLYGYYRATTPRLDARNHELLVFKDVVSRHCHTHSSLKASLSFEEGEDSNPFTILPSIVDLMNQANFRTYWISNQVAFGRWNTPVGAIAARADKVMFLNPEQYRFGATSYDEVVLGPLSEILQDPVPKKFIVVHLRGTHASYADRYPQKYNQFGDRPVTMMAQLNEKQLGIINSYDNAVRYSDYIVDEIISQVNAATDYAAVLYFSDHGEEVFDFREMIGHNESIPSRYMFEIPFVLWTSARFREANQNFISAARANLDMPLSTGTLVHSLQDFTATFSERYQPTRSIFSSSFQPDPIRLIGNIPYEREHGMARSVFAAMGQGLER
jgi:heptose-I-phosphate ethanolaminephosphotransferase